MGFGVVAPVFSTAVIFGMETSKISRFHLSSSFSLLTETQQTWKHVWNCKCIRVYCNRLLPSCTICSWTDRPCNPFSHHRYFSSPSLTSNLTLNLQPLYCMW